MTGMTPATHGDAAGLSGQWPSSSRLSPLLLGVGSRVTRSWAARSAEWQVRTFGLFLAWPGAAPTLTLALRSLLTLAPCRAPSQVQPNTIPMAMSSPPQPTPSGAWLSILEIISESPGSQAA